MEYVHTEISAILSEIHAESRRLSVHKEAFADSNTAMKHHELLLKLRQTLTDIAKEKL
jgi:hypothetical protein